VFTALFASHFLKEKITIFDWTAVFVAFSGILIMQNPFKQSINKEDTLTDLIGSALALCGAMFAATSMVAIRTMNFYSKNIGMLVAPMGFVIGNTLLCPIFMVAKLLYSPVDHRS